MYEQIVDQIRQAIWSGDRGSFVLPQDESETRERLLARLDAQLDDAVATARLAGLDLSDLHERTARRWTEKKQTGGKPAEKE